METKKMSEGHEERFFIYAGTDGTSHKYALLPKDYENDGRAFEGSLAIYKKKFGTGRPGSIFSMETKIDESGVRIPKINYPIGTWKNRVQVLQWQAISRAAEDAKKMQTEASKDRIEEHLEPLRLAYNRCRTRNERAVFIGRIIAYLN